MLFGLLYDYNRAELPKGSKRPHDAFGSTMKDALFYFVDGEHQNRTGLGPGDKFQQEPFAGYTPPREIRDHNLGGVREGYVEDPNDPARDITGRHDHFIVNMINRANGVLSNVGSILHELASENSTTDKYVNAQGRILGDMFFNARRNGTTLTDPNYPQRLKDGKELTRWIASKLCDDSKCGKPKWNPGNRFYD